MDDKQKYGIVYTPENLVNQVLDLIPIHYYQDPRLKWLDIGAGTGAFTINLYKRLLKNLESKIENQEERHNHIIKNMITMVEIYPPHVEKLEIIFSKEANIIQQDFLSFNPNQTDPNQTDPNNTTITTFDFIIGNPPYNVGGSIKTPTNSKQKKTEDGKAIYTKFIQKALELLPTNNNNNNTNNNSGFLNLVVPSLWLKPDKANLYNTLTNLKIHKLHCLSTSESNKAFRYQAQTPACFFLIENIQTKPNPSPSPSPSPSPIKIYDKYAEKYIEYVLKPEHPIPTHGISIINKMLDFMETTNTQPIKIYKTNSPSKKTILSKTPDPSAYPYTNIKTSYLCNVAPTLEINYSNIPQHFHNIPKVVLAHKMYGFPYFDASGTYGISTRDNYIISHQDYSLQELKEIQCFLSTKFAIFIFSTTNYRMRYLEKYAFTFIPDITNIPNINTKSQFPSLLNQSRQSRDKIIANFFNFAPEEEAIIEKYAASKDYKFFI